MLKCLSDLLLLSFCVYLTLLCLYAFLLPQMFFCAFYIPFSYRVSIPCSHMFISLCFPIFSFAIFSGVLVFFYCIFLLKFLCLPYNEPWLVFFSKNMFLLLYPIMFFESFYCVCIMSSKRGMLEASALFWNLYICFNWICLPSSLCFLVCSN